MATCSIHDAPRNLPGVDIDRAGVWGDELAVALATVLINGVSGLLLEVLKKLKSSDVGDDVGHLCKAVE